MEQLKLRLLNKFGSPDNLENPLEVEVYFPYDNADALIKRMSNGHVRILNSAKGEIEVDLSPFEIQGMKIGHDQSFSIKIYTTGKIKSGTFARTLHIESKTVDGSERKVMVRK